MLNMDAKNEISQEALNQLVESRTRFLNFLRKRLDSTDAAEDLLQNAFVRSLEKGGEIREEESVVAWFYRVLRNSVIDYYRQTGRNKEVVNGILADLDRLATVAPEPKNEMCQCIQPLLDNLKPEYREALMTIDLGEHSLADLASRARITAGNAAVRIHRARDAMRKQVRMTCGACAEHHCVDCHCKHPALSDQESIPDRS